MTIAGVVAAVSMVMAQSSSARFFTWAGYSPQRNWDEYFKTLQDVGMDGILISSGPEGLTKIIPIAQKYGIEVHTWNWIMNNGGIAGEHPEWLDYNALGESLKDSIAYVGYYKFLNPAIPEVREAIKEQVRSLLEVEGLTGISLDYCRYVDAILPTGLWKTYGIVQDKVYPKWDYGYHPEMIRQYKDVCGKEPDSNDPDWLKFRCKVLNDFVNELVEMAHSYGKIISASPFPTPLSSIEYVRQDWGNWKLDMAFPMIYHAFYKKDIAWSMQCIKDCHEQAWNGTGIYYGLSVGDFKGSPEELEKALLEAKKAGAKGFSFYTFDSLTPEQREAVKRVIAAWGK